MAQAFNPNPLSVNGMGVPVQARPVPTEEQALEDTITLLRNSICFFGDDPDAADAVQHCRERIAEVERKLSGMQVAANLKACGVSAITPASFAAWADAEFGRGTCECGGGLYEVRGVVYCNQCEREIPAGKCQVCGLSLAEHPHSERECMEWYAEDYRDADETRADLWQF